MPKQLAGWQFKCPGITCNIFSIVINRYISELKLQHVGRTYQQVSTLSSPLAWALPSRHGGRNGALRLGCPRLSSHGWVCHYPSPPPHSVAAGVSGHVGLCCRAGTIIVRKNKPQNILLSKHGFQPRCYHGYNFQSESSLAPHWSSLSLTLTYDNLTAQITLCKWDQDRLVWNRLPWNNSVMKKQIFYK